MKLVITPNNREVLSIKEIWRYRDLFYFLTWRDLKVRYKQTIIGIAWAIIQPLITMIIFSFFFNKLIGISSGNIPYIIFSYSGLIFWNFFSSSLNEASNSFISNQSIITKIFFPRVIAPTSSVMVSLVDFVLSFSILIALMIYLNVQVSVLGLLMVVLGLILSFIAVLGLGIFLATFNSKYRDVRYALPFFIQLLLFLTPVIYPISTIPEEMRWILYLNPITGALELVRIFLLHGTSSGLHYIYISVISAVLIFALGIFYFNKYEKELADVL